MKLLKSLLFVIAIVIVGSIIVGWFVLRDAEVLSPEILETDMIDRYPSPTTITIDGIELNVDVAETVEEMVRGLSGRTGLAEDEGMLFVYDKPDRYSFWMKEMNFSIDIIWIDENLKVVDINKNIQPDSFSQTFQPQKPAQYVLEVSVGFADKNNIKIGDLVNLSGIVLGKKFEELVFAEDSKNDEVVVLTKEGEIVKRIKVDHGPHDIAFSPDGKFVVTANFHAGTVSIINVQNLSLEKTIITGEGAHGVVFSPDSSFLFVANAKEDTLSIIKTTTFTKQTKVNVGNYPEYVGITKDGAKIFTTNLGDGGSITVLQNIGFESKVIKEITSGIDPHGWALSPDGTKIVFTNLGSNFIYLLDAQTFEEISHIDTGATTEFAAFLTSDEIWVTNIGSHYVSVIDSAQNKVIAQILVGETPHGISFSIDKTLAFVPLYEPGEIVIIDVGERKIIKKVKVGGQLHNVIVLNRDKRK